MKIKRAKSKKPDRAPEKSQRADAPHKEVAAHQTEVPLHDLYRQLRDPKFAVDYILQVADTEDVAALRRAVEDLITAFTIDFAAIPPRQLPTQFSEMPKTYRGLCRVLLPYPIHTRTECEDITRIVELMAGHEMTTDQEDYFELLCTLVEHYEEQTGATPSEQEVQREAERIRKVQIANSQKHVCNLVRRLPSDFEPYGKRSRDTDYGPDCSCGCKFFHSLERELDWGICTNPRSPRAGLLTFEHMGCKEFKAA